MTCVEMPLRELGRRAVELVLDKPWDAPIHETLQEVIVVSPGATVAPPLPGTGRPGTTAYIKVRSDP